MTGRRRTPTAEPGRGASGPADAPSGRRWPVWAWVALVGGLLVVLLGATTVPWRWWPQGAPHPVSAAAEFPAAFLRHAASYSWAARAIGWSSLALSLATWLTLALSGRGARMVARLRGPWWWRTPVAAAMLTLLVRVVTAPFGLALSRLNASEGLSTQSVAGWLADWARSGLVTAVVTALLALLVVAAARLRGPAWPVHAALGAAVLVLAGSFVYPLAVEPLFNSFTPMPPGELRSSLTSMAARQGVDVDQVLVADASRRTTTVNAYVSGFGSSHRLVVYDTLLASLPPDEVRSVVAHELGHAAHHDVLVGTGLGAAGAVLGVGLLAGLLGDRRLLRRVGAGGAADPRVVPLLLAAVSVGSVLALPVQNAVSRAIEVRADRTALATTHDPESFVRLQRTLARRSLSDPSPPALSQLWFGSHPTPLQRIALGRCWEHGGCGG